MSSRARWIPVVVLVAVAALCVRLGGWQLDRLAERRAANARLSAVLALPEDTLAARAPAGDTLGGATGSADTPAARTAAGRVLAGRRVIATGTYDRGHEIVLRGQAFRETPGVVIVTPLRLAGAGDTAVLVERGFVPSPDAATLPPDPLDEPGEVTIRGVALQIPSGGGEPVVNGSRTTWRRLDVAALRAELPYPILDVYIHQLPDRTLPLLPRRRPLPPLDDGPHLSYAIQWFAFATMAVVFAAILGRRTRLG